MKRRRPYRHLLLNSAVRGNSRGAAIHISHLSLLNFRNYESLELDLEPGMVLVHGENGQGKSNLLEAIYVLAIAKSPRASADRELIRWQSTQSGGHSQVLATAQRGADQTRVQIDFQTVPAPDEGQEDRKGDLSQGAVSVQKHIRVNGVPRRASELVGLINAVMFSAEDLELVYGPPALRRRYLDILISQLDRQYLRALQRYQRVVYQRNHLLRMVRNGRSGAGELSFWDDKLATEGEQVMVKRARTVRRLSDLAGPIHEGLTGNGEGLELRYRPSVPVEDQGLENGLAGALRRTMEASRDREIAQGVTMSGPHRDDLSLLLDGRDAGVFASRGQARTVALAMRLAEAAHMMSERRQEPILLLDDVLSELDKARRAQVLGAASQYEQCFITTADLDSIEGRFLSGMHRFAVRDGRLEQVDAPAS